MGYPSGRGAKLGILHGGIICKFSDGKIIFRKHYGRIEYHVSLQEVWEKIVIPEIPPDPPASESPIEPSE